VAKERRDRRVVLSGEREKRRAKRMPPSVSYIYTTVNIYVYVYVYIYIYMYIHTDINADRKFDKEMICSHALMAI